MASRWTKEEEDTLRRLVAGGLRHPVDMVEHLPGRTFLSIGARMQKMGLKPSPSEARKPYSKAEMERIRLGRAAGMTYGELSLELGRPAAALRAKAYDMGIERVRGRGHGNGAAVKAIPFRRCLMHRGRFQPEHPGEYVCPSCKKTGTWKDGSGPFDPVEADAGHRVSTGGGTRT